MENNDSKDIVHTDIVRTVTPEVNPETGLPIGLKVVSKPPKKKCKKCYGRGHIGWINGDRNQPYPCMCTLEVVLDTPEPAPEKTATEPASTTPMPTESNVTSTDLPNDCTGMGDPKPESTELTNG